MQVENHAQPAENTADANAATYVDAALKGKHQWWRYLVGLVVILVAWLVVGSVASLHVEGTTELAIGAHFANNLGFFLVVNAAGSVATTPALFTVSQ